MSYNRRPRKRLCRLCQAHHEHVDYKDKALVESYINVVGKILPRRATGACAMHQRRIAIAIKRARYIALIPYIKSE